MQLNPKERLKIHGVYERNPDIQVGICSKSLAGAQTLLSSQKRTGMNKDQVKNWAEEGKTMFELLM